MTWAVILPSDLGSKAAVFFGRGSAGLCQSETEEGGKGLKRSV